MSTEGPMGCTQTGSQFMSPQGGGIVIRTDLISAVEARPWVAQTCSAHVRVHLVGGQTIKVWCGDYQESSDRARDLARYVAGLMPGRP